jgi:hypothetical protein
MFMVRAQTTQSTHHIARTLADLFKQRTRASFWLHDTWRFAEAVP